MTFSSTGFDAPTQTEISDEIETDLRADVGDQLDLSTSAPWGQLTRRFSRGLRLVWEALEGLSGITDPDSVTGAALDRLSAITGTTREPATFSTVDADVNVDPGTYAIGTLVAFVAGRPEDRFLNTAEVVNGGGSPANVTGVPFQAETAGPVAAPSGQLTGINPVSGWNGVTNPLDAVLGRDVETDAELRVRRAQEVEAPGSTSAAGIAADISRNITEVISVYVLENDTDATVDGIPPHAIEAVVYGPASPSSADDEEVATQILASKAAGIGTEGTTTVGLLDSQNFVKTVKFTRPTTLTPTVEIDLDAGPDYAGDTAVTDEIVAKAQEVLRPGRDVGWSNVAAWALGVQGVLRVTDVEINAASLTDLSVDARQIALISSGNVTVNSTPTDP